VKGASTIMCLLLGLGDPGAGVCEDKTTDEVEEWVGEG
jgi:hypothetical protein